jgi:heme/copper-type cytochrome/quinol oxidase subunit 2
MLTPQSLSSVLAALNWWLPENYAAHGRSVDSLFTWIFWISMVVMVGVFVAMAWFLYKYRYNPNRRAVYSHGNTRLEIVWTVIPSIILVGISIASTRVWHNYRYADSLRDPSVNPARILVIGEQFKWNIIYPGPDNRFGRYLIYPRPTDARWPDGNPFQNYAAPRDVPPNDAAKIIQQYVASSDAARLGKDMSDPDGKDDMYEGSLGRVMDVPFDRPIDVTVTSKDVIHSFALNNFRVKLDTVPGLRGLVSFTVDDPLALTSEREKLTRETLPIDQVVARFAANPKAELYVHIDESSPGAEDAPGIGWRYSAEDPRRKGRRVSVIRTGGAINYAPDNPRIDTLSRLKELGVTQLTVYTAGYFDISCQELCGSGHYTMQAQLKVIPAVDYAAKYDAKPAAAAASN